MSSLVYIAMMFEAIGMLTISRYTLNATITQTIDFNSVQNLRKGFICLGSTQLCSALIMLCILIFTLPMSTTQVVISGLTGISFIYFNESESNLKWFWFEFLMWITCPLLALGIAYSMHSLIQSKIFDHPQATKRIITLMPY